MNSLNLVGRLAKDVKAKEVGEKKTKMVRGTIAVTDNYNREKTNFINFTMFGKQAENFEKVLDKGDLIGLMNAEMKVDQYEKEEETKYNVYALASNWQLLRKKGDNKENSTQPTEEKQEPSEDEEYDVLEEEGYPF